MINSLLSHEWFLRFNQFKRLIVGFSGGLDSTVLLHVLATHSALFSKLVPVHVNHGLSVNADYWQTQCQQFCSRLDIPLLIHSVHCDRRANIEEEARIARYSLFSSLIIPGDCLILGHHRDDQAETLLLQLFRGAGIDGLAAMAELSPFGVGQLARPFLNHLRMELAHYAQSQKLHWIDDESNQDTRYSRNYLRQYVMPLLKNKWPGVVRNIVRTASHCQQAKRNLDALAESDLAGMKLTNNSLSIAPLQKLNFDHTANVLRVWLKKNEIQLPATATLHRLINEVIFSRYDAVPVVSWGKIVIRRYKNYLYIDTKNRNLVSSSVAWSTFPMPLTLADAGINLTAKKTTQGLEIPSNTKIKVRFRQGGEEFVWHGQTKRLKKLFQEWGIPPWLRERIPLVYFNSTLAAVIGYAISDLFYSKESVDAWIIESRLLEENKSVSEIAKTFKVHKATIYRLAE